MKRIINILQYCCLALLLAVVPFSSVWAAATEKVVTNVTSENMVYDSAAQKVVFTGNVKVTHPDYTLTSDRLNLFLGDSGSGGGRQSELNTGVVKSIVAESKVHINLPEGRTANCNKATYHTDTETLVMEGSPVLREGPNQIKGDRMIFYLRENRNEVQGRVTVDFISSDGPNSSGSARP